jgi:urease gamma subunit
MTLSDEELTLYAIREAQIILADYVQPGPRDGERTIQQLLEVLDRNDVIEAVDRLEAKVGLRLA